MAAKAAAEQLELDREEETELLNSINAPQGSKLVDRPRNIVGPKTMAKQHSQSSTFSALNSVTEFSTKMRFYKRISRPNLNFNFSLEIRL